MKNLYKTLFALTIAGAILLAGSPAHAQNAAAGKNVLTVKGSDTLVNLSAMWAEAFMAKNPDAMVSVTGGGSGVGISALLGGTTDICNASRDIKPEEKKKGAEAGVYPFETNVALDGIAIVVNPKNPLQVISIEQLNKIYSGDAKNWKDLGGADEKIVVLSRETSSGTYVFFQEVVLGKKDYTPSARLMPATAAIIESVASDE
ncbi:MAG: phosphate transport system substrate-binding protein, partial [Candidatus Hydrogenedentes bacterium]|nr:phosphate transport system substrate-binding protein [Candidatus Hydrogenedentota bacterium]